MCCGGGAGLGFRETAPNQILSLSLPIGHGSHRESSPFLSPLEASRGSDYYDRNLALFEVDDGQFCGWAGVAVKTPASARQAGGMVNAEKSRFGQSRNLACFPLLA